MQPPGCGETSRHRPISELTALEARRSFKATDVLAVLEDAFGYGMPAFLRSDNGPEFIAKAVKRSIHGYGQRDHSEVEG